MYDEIFASDKVLLDRVFFYEDTLLSAAVKESLFRRTKTLFRKPDWGCKNFTF